MSEPRDRTAAFALEPAASDEAAVLARLIAGDQEAFEALVHAHHGSMLRVARLFIAKQDVAEEVVQETWLAVLRALRSFEGRSSLKTWIFRILANRARTRAVREARVIPFAELAATEEESGGDDIERRFAADGHWSDPPSDWKVRTPEALVLRQEVMAQLAVALEALPPAQRAVVTLRDVEGWPSEDVCDSLQISEGNQRVLLHRGRIRLRAALAAALGQR
jgi:RNA polymerase sigma-70 factor (ECF subfamily)